MAALRSSMLELSCLALLSFGCGSGTQQVLVPDQAAADAGPSLQLYPTVNVCPVFNQSLVNPRSIAPGASAEVVVFVTDPDGFDGSLVFDWSASSGSFSEPKSSATLYRCDARGPQLLNVRALDRLGCSTQLDLDVTCSDD